MIAPTPFQHRLSLALTALWYLCFAALALLVSCTRPVSRPVARPAASTALAPDSLAAAWPAVVAPPAGARESVFFLSTAAGSARRQERRAAVARSRALAREAGAGVPRKVKVQNGSLAWGGGDAAYVGKKATAVVQSDSARLTAPATALPEGPRGWARRLAGWLTAALGYAVTAGLGWAAGHWGNPWRQLRRVLPG
ncbi:hypothetical protein [Hymenobacter sp.]|uniref:hypothetical protein n=1 Tax=Hymenobacter sp. TaxID=1898978 RepID=UPI00286C228D|nr:hypothetical protein [Hymenobacter sp.]